jgi:hypothetical protein
MPGVSRKLAEHRIDLNEGSKPVKQRLRRFAPDKKTSIKKKITKLLAAGFIREILHPDWLANPMLVRKDSIKSLVASTKEEIKVMKGIDPPLGVLW